MSLEREPGVCGCCCGRWLLLLLLLPLERAALAFLGGECDRSARHAFWTAAHAEAATARVFGLTAGLQPVGPDLLVDLAHRCHGVLVQVYHVPVSLLLWRAPYAVQPVQAVERLARPQDV
jgi:hypothetical protein